MKKNYRIYVECIKYSSGFKVGEKTLLATIYCLGNTYVCAKSLSATYKPEFWKMTVE